MKSYILLLKTKMSEEIEILKHTGSRPLPFLANIYDTEEIKAREDRAFQSRLQSEIHMKTDISEELSKLL